MSQVRIFGAAPGTAAVTWQQVADLSAELKAQLVASKWQVSSAHRQPLHPLQSGLSACRLCMSGCWPQADAWEQPC